MKVNGSVIGILRANAEARIEAESAKEGGGNKKWIARDKKLVDEDFKTHIRFFGLYRWEKVSRHFLFCCWWCLAFISVLFVVLFAVGCSLLISPSFPLQSLSKM